MIGTGESLQTQNIRRCPIKNKENFDVIPKFPPEFRHCGFRVSIVPIPHGVALVRLLNGLQHLRMHNRVIIAGKTTTWFHDKTI